jgi:hypothetical protein
MYTNYHMVNKIVTIVMSVRASRHLQHDMMPKGLITSIFTSLKRQNTHCLEMEVGGMQARHSLTATTLSKWII